MQAVNSKVENPVIRLLHVSDIHFGCKDPSGHQPRIADSLERAVKAFSDDIDFIVFTGDLTQSARADQFQLGQDWLVRLSGITGAPIVLVPGNHDVNRAAAAGSVLLDLRKSEIDFATALNSLKSEAKHFDPFSTWFQQAKQDQEKFLNNWGDSTALTVDLVSTNAKGVVVNFLCLNTAIASFQDKEQGKLCADIPSINKGLMQVDANKQLVIAVGHHPLTWLIKWNREQVSAILKQETGAHMYMHGHMHTDSTKAEYAGTGDGITFSEAGAAYPGAKWNKSFSILELKPSSGQFQPSVYTYSERSGQWDHQPERSKVVGMKFPPEPTASFKVTAVKLPQAKHLSPKDDVSTSGHNWNPFLSVISNGISAQAVHKLFVDKRDTVTDLARPQDALIEGQRGTGKTMLLRYFSAEVQRSISKTNQISEFVSYLNNEGHPFGIYGSIAPGGFDRTDFLSVKNAPRRSQLFAARMSAFLAGTVFHTLHELSKVLDFSAIDSKSLCDTAWRALTAGKSLDFDGNVTPTELFGECRRRCDELIGRVDNHLGSLVPGGEPTTLNPETTFSSYTSMLREVQQRLFIKTPFFMLLDDVDHLGKDEQTALFGLASARNHSLVCYKFGMISDGQKSFHSAPGKPYKVDDDYDPIRLNWVDHGIRGKEKEAHGTSYADVVKEIFRLRVEMANWPIHLSFFDIFSEWEQGEKIRAQVRNIHEITHSNQPPSQKAMSSFKSMWDKQGEAIYLRHLRKVGTPHRYAGPYEIIDLSSGIFRQFLEICYSVVSKAMSGGWSPNGGAKISPSIQHNAIQEWSEQWLKKLVESGNDSATPSSKEVATGLHVAILAQSLSKFFSERLYSDSKDPELFAISVKGEIKQGSFCEQLLRLAVRESVLQPRQTDYTSKSDAGVRLPTYFLNRRLAPHARVGTKMQGRYEISVTDLELAATDVGRFLRIKVKVSNQGVLDL
jgi:predicted MPP superfamily phosphohydrolase